MTNDDFEEKIRQGCGYWGVALQVDEGRYVNDGTGDSNGWFDDTIPKLAYAKGHDGWFPIAVHEYNHMCQWVEKDPAFHNTLQKEADDYFWLWLNGSIDLPYNKQRAYCMSYLKVELDCDRRVIKMIKDLTLNLDPDYYAQTSNAYTLFYHMILKHRKWYEIGKEPYNISEIVSQMPKDLYTLNYEEISDEMVDLFESNMPYLFD